MIIANIPVSETNQSSSVKLNKINQNLFAQTHRTELEETNFPTLILSLKTKRELFCSRLEIPSVLSMDVSRQNNCKVEIFFEIERFHIT